MFVVRLFLRVYLAWCSWGQVFDDRVRLDSEMRANAVPFPMTFANLDRVQHFLFKFSSVAQSSLSRTRFLTHISGKSIGLTCVVCRVFAYVTTYVYGPLSILLKQIVLPSWDICAIRMYQGHSASDVTFDFRNTRAVEIFRVEQLVRFYIVVCARNTVNVVSGFVHVHFRLTPPLPSKINVSIITAGTRRTRCTRWKPVASRQTNWGRPVGLVGSRLWLFLNYKLYMVCLRNPFNNVIFACMQYEWKLGASHNGRARIRGAHSTWLNLARTFYSVCHIILKSLSVGMFRKRLNWPVLGRFDFNGLFEHYFFICNYQRYHLKKTPRRWLQLKLVVIYK